MMSRQGLALALLAVLALAATASAFPSRGRRVARSAHANNYYPDLYVQQHPQAQASASTPYLYQDDYDYDADADYSQEQWWDTAASDTAANAAFLQNLMEANQLNDRLDRMGLGQGQGLGLGQELGLGAVLPAYSAPPRYLDPRYRDSDDYVFGSVNAGTSSLGAGRSGAYEPAAYGRYQYRVDQEDDDDDVRELHALAKKSRTEEQRLQDLETQALIKAALGRHREGLEEQNRRGEFYGEASDQLDQDLEKLFAKSGFANMYRGQEPKPWNGKDPVWNGYYMATMEDTMPQRATRSKTQYQYLQAAASTKAPVPVPAPAAASTERPAARTTAPPATTTAKSTTTTTASKATPPTPAPMKRMLGVGQRSGQPEVAMFRPATPRVIPLITRPVVRGGPRATNQRPAIHHQGGVDEIRNLLRVQDTMGPRNADLLSLLPSVSKRSAPIVADEGSLVDELAALKKKAN